MIAANRHPANQVSAASSAGSTYFRPIQILRGLAALAVLLYHVNLYAETICSDKNTWFKYFGPSFSGGWCVFFVLSGFLMAYLVHNGTRYFLPRRLVRIYPTYWLATFLVVTFRTIVCDIPFNWRMISLMPLLPHKPLTNGLDYPLGVEWTLIYEIFFYFVCTVFANRYLRRYFPAFLSVWLVVIAIIQAFWLSPIYVLPTWKQVWISPSDVFFICGALGYYVYHAMPQFKWRSAVPFFIAAMPVLVMARLAVNSRGIGGLGARFGILPIYSGNLLYSFGLLLIMLPWMAAERNRKPTKPSILEKLGDYSYALYLIHVPVISYLFLVAAPNNGNRNALALLGFIYALLAGVLLGKVDVSIHNASRKLFSSRRAVSRPLPAQENAEEPYVPAEVPVVARCESLSHESASAPSAA